MAFRLIVAGMGSRGREWVRTIRSMPDVALAAYVDTDEARLRTAATTFGLASDKCFRRLDDALAAVPCEALIVATSLNQHVEPCQAAIAWGLGVLVEKPFTTDLRQATMLVGEAERRRVPIVVGQNYRYTRAPRAARRVIASGAIGRVGKFACRVYRPVDTGSAPAVAEVPDGLWWELSVHHLDALRYVFGEPDRVLARIASPAWDGARHRASHEVLFAFDGGPVGFLETFYDSRGHEFFEHGREYYLRVAGENGTLHVLNRWLVCCVRGKLPRLVRRGPRRETEEAQLLRQLVDSVRTGVEPESSGRDNLKTVALLEACLRSAAAGSWVEPTRLLHAGA